MERLLELWYKIPREREWWIDRISAILSGCSTGCFVLVMTYVFTVLAACLVAFTMSNDSAEALVLGLAWGSSLWLVTASVGGSAVLALYTRLRAG